MEDVYIYENIFGPDMSRLEGKIIRTKPNPVHKKHEDNKIIYTPAS